MKDTRFSFYLSERTKKLLKAYGPPALLIGFLINHFGHRRKSGSPISYLQSITYAVRSRTLWNMGVSSGLVSYFASRYFGVPFRRIFFVYFATIWSLLYRFRIVEKPKVWYRRTHWNTHVVEKAKIAQTAFNPVVWAFNRHAQTITCYLISFSEWLWSDTIDFDRETIPSFDGVNEIFIDWAHYSADKDAENVNTEEEEEFADAGAFNPAFTSIQSGYDKTNTQKKDSAHWETPVLILIHGLGDHKDIPYMKRFARMCLQHGWKVAVYSYWRFDFEESRDLHLLIKHIEAKNPGSPLIAVAWSAGAHMLIRYLQKIGEDTPLVCAICQAGCYDFITAVENVTTNENTTYPMFLLAQAQIGIRRHLRNDKRISKEERRKFDSILLSELHPMNLFNRFYCALPRDDDDTNGVDRVGDVFLRDIRHLGHEGFLSDGESFKEQVATAAWYTSRAIDNFQKIKVTTLLLHAEDDPVVGVDHVDWNRIKSNRNVIVSHTKRGGHCAWHEGFVPVGDTWGDRVATNFVSTVLESHAQTHFIIGLVHRAMANLSIPGATPPLPLSLKHKNSSNSDLYQSNGFTNLTPSTMARITSASDLASMGKPKLRYMHS
eukprot:CAMPEP_0204862268 /NCGR_PEP_ID=MMETSP1348-20121228/2344_1 /ASSEMBLY_ACC=CAM_ASM_000700 /TAXON_ID=215587 /ORGANISM="Aplanochytrium stocchinoi, Strain GSBS06" /LENGTH=603 /DNA_ID=CAMNT_0052012103 /DNA_START=228 /DNA_END=2039 /DNA_ORIENTATION=-